MTAEQQAAEWRRQDRATQLREMALDAMEDRRRSSVQTRGDGATIAPAIRFGFHA